MNQYVKQGHNVTNAGKMNEAMQEATSLLGFNSNVMEIEKSQYPQSSKIKNITQFHNIEYVYDEDEPPKCRFCRHNKIGLGKVFELPECLDARSYNVKSPFREMLFLLEAANVQGQMRSRVSSFALMKTVSNYSSLLKIFKNSWTLAYMIIA